MNVIGRCKSIDGQKQKPESGCFTGFLASPARFERAAPRLGATTDSLNRVQYLSMSYKEYKACFLCICKSCTKK